MTNYVPVTSDISDREIRSTRFDEKMRRRAAEQGSRLLAEALQRYFKRGGRA